MYGEQEEERLVSLDAYRGFVMLAMASGGLSVASTLSEHPRIAGDSEKPLAWIWYNLAHHLHHREWLGCSFWDLIQPSFMFIVGVAIPFSFLHRVYNSNPFDRGLHVLMRAFLLVVLGVFLYSQSTDIAHFTFVNVLTQIGLGYPFVYWMLQKSSRTHLMVTAIILVGYGCFFHLGYAEADAQATREFLAEQQAANPDAWDDDVIRPDHFDDEKLQVWNKHTNASARVDRILLNLFPREGEAWRDRKFWVNRGGYQTLSFIPSIVTMLFGLMAGRIMCDSIGHWRKLGWLLKMSALCFVVAMLCDTTIWPVKVEGMNWSICPVVKRIWTPTWTVFSAGWAFLLLAAFYFVLDIVRVRFWAFPLIVVGMNSIAMYVMYQLLRPWLQKNLRMVLNTFDQFAGTTTVDAMFGPNQPYAAIFASVSTLLMLWLIVYWMYRRKLFVRI